MTHITIIGNSFYLPINFYILALQDSARLLFKRSVQREVWGVESIRKSSVRVWDHGVGYSFFYLFSRHLVLNLFPFPLSKGKISRKCLTEQAMYFNFQ